MFSQHEVAEVKKKKAYYKYLATVFWNFFSVPAEEF